MVELTVTGQSRYLTEFAPIKTELTGLYNRASEGLRLKLGNSTEVAAYRKCYIAGTTAYIPFTGTTEVNVTEANQHMQSLFGPTATIVFRASSGQHSFSFSVEHLFGPSNGSAAALAYASAPSFNLRLFLVVIFWIVALTCLLMALRTSPSPTLPPLRQRHHH